MENRSLKDIIADSGRKLSENGSDSLPNLRNLQNALSNRQERDDKRLRVVVFFLDGLIDDICFNLTGDFPSEDRTNEIINEFFKEFGRYLTGLSDDIEAKKDYIIFKPLVEMVNCYLNTLQNIKHAL